MHTQSLAHVNTHTRKHTTKHINTKRQAEARIHQLETEQAQDRREQHMQPDNTAIAAAVAKSTRIKDAHIAQLTLQLKQYSANGGVGMVDDGNTGGGGGVQHIAFHQTPPFGRGGQTPRKSMLDMAPLLEGEHEWEDPHVSNPEVARLGDLLKAEQKAAQKKESERDMERQRYETASVKTFRHFDG